MKKELLHRIPLFLAVLFLGTAAPTNPPTEPGLLALVAPVSIAVAQDKPDIKPDVNIKIDTETDRGETVFFLSPTFLLIGGLVLVGVIAFIALAARGGGTTIIREK